MADQNKLHQAAITLRGNLVQLDYLQELLNKSNLTDPQRREVNGQLRRITVNFKSAIRDVDELANGMPIIGEAH